RHLSLRGVRVPALRLGRPFPGRAGDPRSGGCVMVDQDKATQMAAIVREIEEVGRAKKEANKQFSEQLSALWLALENLAGDVESGQQSLGLGPDTELRDADGNP